MSFLGRTRQLLRHALVPAVLFLLPSIATPSNLLPNPGFENVTIPFASPHFSDWNEFGNFELSTSARSGLYAVSLGPNGASVVSNKLSLAPGLYEFGAWFKYYADRAPLPGNYDKGGVTANIKYTAGGNEYPYYAVDFETATGWTQENSGNYTTGWFLISGTFLLTQPVDFVEINVSFQDNTSDGRVTSALADDAFLQAVPEPGSLLLLGTGLVAVVRRRLNK